MCIHYILYMNDITDIMKIIETEDKELLLNKRVYNMSRIDFGKTIAVSNQYIQQKILQECLIDYKVLSTDDKIPEYINNKNNSPGFDLVIIKQNKSYIRIQSKFRQVNGVTDLSRQLHFETTRRNSTKNKDKNHTGHVCYSIDEFDFVMISIVNDRSNTDIRKNCNLWSYVLIPINELIDEKRNCCVSSISVALLSKYLINSKKDVIRILELNN